MASEIRANLISPATASTVTFGSSGQTIALGSGATASGFGGGKVLQVVQGSSTAVVSGSANSWVTVTGLTATITPSATSSQILIVASLSYTGPSANNSMVRLARGSTGIGVGDVDGARTPSAFKMNRISAYGAESGNITFLDSPATTSATTYNIQARSSVDTNTWYFNRMNNDANNEETARGGSHIILMEIGA
jgi:hypothetical protein